MARKKQETSPGGSSRTFDVLKSVHSLAWNGWAMPIPLMEDRSFSSFFLAVWFGQEPQFAVLQNGDWSSQHLSQVQGFSAIVQGKCRALLSASHHLHAAALSYPLPWVCAVASLLLHRSPSLLSAQHQSNLRCWLSFAQPPQRAPPSLRVKVHMAYSPRLMLPL